MNKPAGIFRFGRHTTVARPSVIWRRSAARRALPAWFVAGNPRPGAQRKLFSLICLLALPCLSHAAATEWKVNPEGQVRLIASDSVVSKTGSLLLGLHFKTAPGWYVYWKMAGDAGYPPSFKWEGSEGIKKPQLLWPAPTKFILPGNIIEYGYEGEGVYPIRVQLATTEGRVRASAAVSYLTCNSSCIPYKYEFILDLPVGEAVPDPQNQELIERYVKEVPPAGMTDEEIMRSAPVVRKDAWPSSEKQGAPLSTLTLLLFAFLGGLLLNVMPCVLPVLSIKLLGLLQHSGQARATIVRNALASAAGIIGSFMALALAAIAARNTGHAIGWGIQFQEPVFVGFLALVVFFFALNLWGMFEIGLPSLLGQFAVTFGRGETLSAYFLSGLFATLLATPCSAPFLGTAMGFALFQPPLTILAIFTAVGAGMALPYFVLAAFPRTFHWLPKPGPWMVHLRTILGFLLAATVVWLAFVLSMQIRPEGMAYFYLSLVGIGFAAWLRELLLTHPRLGSPWARRLITLLMVALIVGILRMVNRNRSSGPVRHALSSEGALTWVPFDETHVEALTRDGKTVFVDVTANWCVTCKYNERFVLSDPDVSKAFRDAGIVMMQADWTSHDAAITSYLEKNGRAGIPFYALYRPGRSPVLLSEFLGKAKVLEALKS